MQAGTNFRLRMLDQHGQEVPGSVREGHNVFTRVGRETIARLFCWSSLGSSDAAFTQKRARWIGIGGGLQPENPDVIGLVSPLEVTAGVYVKVIDAGFTEFPLFTSVLMKTVFLPAELTFSDPAVVVSEAGMYFDSSTETDVDASQPDNQPAFYKTFAPVVKLNSFSMEVSWELKF